MPEPRIWLTDAGAAAFRDPNNRQLQAVRFTRLAVGTGVGPQNAADAAGRATLRTRRAVVDLAGRDSTGGRFILRADIPPANPGYVITELGVLAQVGNTGAEFLALYGAVPDAVGEDVFGVVSPATTLVMPLSIDVVAMAAEFSANLAADIQIADVPAATQAVVGKARFATSREATTGTAADLMMSPATTAAAVPAATQARAGKSRFGTTAEVRAGALTDVGVSPATLKAMLGLITVLHFAASNPARVWNLPFTRALVILKGADGGGGGAALAPAVTGVRGQDGGDTVLSVGGQERARAAGGTGGLGGNRLGLSRPALPYIAGRGRGGRGFQNRSHPGRNGMNGGGGAIVVTTIAGLTPASVLSIVIGSGGVATNSGVVLDPGDAAPAAGAAGWMRIVPLPNP